jgi:excisionase family DNA binding protein
VSITEAARLSGRSDKTIRRWIKAGRLRAIKADSGYLIDSEDLSAMSRTGVGIGVDTVLDAGVDNDRNDREDVPPSELPGTDIMRAEAMAAYTRSLLEPLVATIERQADRVAELERENGRQAAELEAARAQISSLTAPTAPDPPDLTPGAPTAPEPVTGPWWRRWLLAVFG